MNLSPFTIDKDEAQIAYELYREQHAKTKSEEDLALTRAYRAVAQGKQVISLQTVMRAGGLDAQGYPKLAIARADQTRVFVNFNPNTSKYRGDCEFYSAGRPGWSTPAKNRILIPEGTFPKWRNPDPNVKFWAHREQKQTIVPNIPPKHQSSFKLGLYHVLWEVEKWELVPPIDPALLKEIGAGLYIVLAVWDLTDLERAVIGDLRGKNLR